MSRVTTRSITEVGILQFIFFYYLDISDFRINQNVMWSNLVPKTHSCAVT